MRVGCNRRLWRTPCLVVHRSICLRNGCAGGGGGGGAGLGGVSGQQRRRRDTASCAAQAVEAYQWGQKAWTAIGVQSAVCSLEAAMSWPEIKLGPSLAAGVAAVWTSVGQPPAYCGIMLYDIVDAPRFWIRTCPAACSPYTACVHPQSCCQDAIF